MVDVVTMMHLGQQLDDAFPRIFLWRTKSYVIGRGVYILLYIVYKSALFFGTNLISPKILTFRGLF